MPQNICQIITQNLFCEEAVFVFPSELAANSFADQALIFGAEQNICVVPMEKFIAWDTFLETAVLPSTQLKEKTQQIKSVNNIFRRMFASYILNENVESVLKKNAPLFSTIIRPEFAEFSGMFTDWLSSILPQLGIWCQKRLGISIEKIKPENSVSYLKLEKNEEDFIKLIVLYKDFLNKNSLFESAWERPPFTPNGKTYFLFFTEALSDFQIYQELFKAAAPHIKIIETPPNEKKEIKKYFLTNSISEITASALYILKLRENGIPFSEIIVTAPRLEDYEPYIISEYKIHGIPVENGGGKPLGVYSAGCLFSGITECISNKMALSFLSALLLNRAVPFKNESQINELLNYGAENNCVLSWEDETGKIHDVWEESFKRRPNDIAKFYRQLKKQLQKICAAGSFCALKDRYFEFRNDFIDVEKFNLPEYAEANAVIGRCVSELLLLARIEKEYPAIKIPSPWSFFCAHINKKIYKLRNDADFFGSDGGVRLLPYRVSASVPSVSRIVLGANQDAMPQIFSELSFISTLKKQLYDMADHDASEIFFNLHQFLTSGSCAFFCSKESFNGFTLPYNGLALHGQEPDSLVSIIENKDYFSDSLYRKEIEKITEISAVSRALSEKSDVFFESQKSGFDQFNLRHENACKEKSVIVQNLDELKKAVHQIYSRENKILLSPTSLYNYRKCAMIWLLKEICRIGKGDFVVMLRDNTAMSPFAAGRSYHAVLSCFFAALKEKELPLISLEDIPLEYLEIINECVFEVFDSVNKSEDALTGMLLYPQQDAVKEKCKLVIKALMNNFNECSVKETEPAPEWEKEYSNNILRGKPDLVLFNAAESSYVIIDFKTNETPDKKDCIAEDGGELNNFQLTSYKRLAETNGFYPVNSGFFVSIKKAKIFDIFGGNKNTGAAFENSALVLDKSVVRYADEISEISFENSYNKTYDECLLCNYKNICRTTFTIQRENRMGRKK